MSTEEKDWKRLSPYQHVRQRTEMYFGSRDPHTQSVLDYGPKGPTVVEASWTPAVFTAFREIVDNGIDEIVAHGHGDRIDIQYDEETKIISVADNGRGIPINWDEEEQNYAATILLSHTLTGRNFDERGETRGVNGVGAKGVNFCSEFFDVTIHREGRVFKQRFTEGDDSPGSDLVATDPVILPAAKKDSGTRIEFRLSSAVFPSRLLPLEFVRARVFEIALAYPQVKVFFNGQRMTVKSVEQALFGKLKPIPFEIEEEGFLSKFWLVPNFAEGAEFAHSLVNAIPVFNGGTHIDAFRRGFYTGLLEALEKESKRRRLKPNRADASDGLLLFNITQMTAPSFDSQSKTRLINEHVSKKVTAAMKAPDFFRKIIRNHPEWIEMIFERCAQRTQKKDQRDIDRMAKNSKRIKIEDLEDAASFDRSKCVLFLAEGKSAISGIVEARDPQIHGGLPLRGKPMNVRENPTASVMANDAMSKIMNAIGLVPGQRVNRHTLRYGRVFITCDADEDGKNIAGLLVNFFFSYWPELFDPTKPAFINVFETPLIIAAKGKQKRYWYNDDYHRFNPDTYKGWEITRAKGLAALKRDDWRELLANPRLVPIIDDGELEATLELVFGRSPGAADRRKEWIGK